MMKLSEADIIKLEDYWAGRLEASEQADIEKRLTEDADFQEAAVAWQLIVKEGFMPTLKEKEEAEIISKRLLAYENSEVDNTIKKQKKTNKFIGVRRLYIGLAAAAALLLLFWLTPLRGIFSNDPYADFFTHLSRDNANLSDVVQDGKQAYDQQNYKAAYPALLAEVEAGGDSLNLIYASVAAIGSGQAEKAIPILELLLEKKEWAFYQSEIRWYLALAYLEEGSETKAVELLQDLMEAKEYEMEAGALMEQINYN